jgi:glyoxylase-like metal-dependent hydrolase (beta-lactamase superfamily II)
MNRERVVLAILAAGLMTIGVAAMQQPAAPAPMVIDVDKLKDNLYVMRGGGGNTAVFLTSAGVVVVDTKSPGGWGKLLLEKIKSVTDKPITTIINTHTHYDHLSGNPDFPATVDIITHENTAGYIKDWHDVYARPPQPNVIKEAGGRGAPKRTFKDKMTIGKGADQIDLYYFGRAHTGGDAYVVFPALRVMHVGDTFPTRNLPIMDKNNGGSGVEYAATLTKAAGVPNIDTLINGHSPVPTAPADLRLYSEYIRDFVSYVQAQKKTGKTMDETITGWATPAKYTGYAALNPAQVKADVEVVWGETK